MPDPVKIGDRAPVFSLPSESGESVSLGDYIGKKPVVLYFYPKDNTVVCTKEACAFRDNYEEFRRLEGAEVFGISSDPVESHSSFSREHGLPFRLLSDEKGTIRELYGVPKTIGIFPGRVTYVIDGDGIVIHIISSQLGYKKHVEEALWALRSSQKGKI
ncbi:MAG: peroxiredoxin [Candidatus Dadabacteria bacterium]|nr:MAG: peroxiredoxin [Candidatus Dadabacteria bacterium]